jgi:hypothetical protein
MWRWAVNVADWTSDEEYQAALRLVEEEEQKRIGRFHFHIDAKR